MSFPWRLHPAAEAQNRDEEIHRDQLYRDHEFYREHGYTLVGSFGPLQVGDLIPANYAGWPSGDLAATTPWRVVATTTRGEFRRWYQTVFGGESRSADKPNAKFYRIEACD